MCVCVLMGGIRVEEDGHALGDLPALELHVFLGSLRVITCGPCLTRGACYVTRRMA